MPAPTPEKHPILGATHTRLGHMAKKTNHLWYNGSGRSEVFCCCFNCNDLISIHSAKPWTEFLLANLFLEQRTGKFLNPY